MKICNRIGGGVRTRGCLGQGLWDGMGGRGMGDFGKFPGAPAASPSPPTHFHPYHHTYPYPILFCPCLHIVTYVCVNESMY